MTFKKIAASVMLFGAVYTFSSISNAQNAMDKDTLSHLLISETSEQGTMINKGKSVYMKRFTLSIINTGTEAIDLSKGCFYATGKDNMLKIKPKIFQPTLRSTIEPGSESDAVQGYIEFQSYDKSVYLTEFVRWTTDCRFME